MTDFETHTTKQSSYLDDYATCAETYATVRIYTGKISPEFVTAALGLQPTKLLRLGKDDSRLNGWLFSSKGSIESRDLRRHLDWLLERLVNQHAELRRLQSNPEVWMDVLCYWRSSQGHGGPTLSPKQTKMLADLNLEIGFDLY